MCDTIETSEGKEPHMRRRGSIVVLAALAVAGVAAGVFVSGGGASSNASEAVIRVSVAATDSKLTLSRRSAPVGTVIFTVTNKGKKPHDFKIDGKKTPSLAPGRSATLRVTFSKQGRYPYISTISGQAAAGMKGVFTVGPAPIPPTPSTTFTTVPTTVSTTVGTANTTVKVDMFDDNGPPRFVLSQTTIPSGMVTFEIANKCFDTCSFDLVGVKAGTILAPGGSETWTVALHAGTYYYHCDVFPLMKGSFDVTP
jgi:uncharacterized cupredoxin-like copper-binding protein